MIWAYHLTWSTYGHWFPNDPRGSWSEEVWQPQLSGVRPLDDDRFVTQPRPVERKESQRFREQATMTLRHHPIVLSSEEIEVVGGVFAEIASRWDVSFLACAILPEHVHMLVRECASPYERLVNALKGRSAQRIREHRAIPVARRRADRVPIWTVGFWVRYVPDADVGEYVAAYIERNPPQHRLGIQRWGFVRGG